MLRACTLLGVALVLFSGMGVAAGPSTQEPVSRDEARQLYAEIVDLMDGSSVVVPELARAGAPLVENARQASKTLESGPARDHVGVVYALITNAKVYLQLVDALPKPPSFSTDVRKQIESMRFKTDRVEAYFRRLLEAREQQRRSPDRDQLVRYRADNQRLSPLGESERRVVFLGDSITDGWRLNQYFPSQPFVNRGIGGQITGQMLGRMPADVIALKPAAMVLLGGTNDLARGVEPATIEANIQMIAQLAELHGIRPVIASLLPVSDYQAQKNPRWAQTALRPPEQIREINAWLEQFAASANFVYLDYYSAMVDEQGMLRLELSDDGLHPNQEGYKIMAPLARGAIAEALKGQRPARRSRKRFGIF